MIGNRIKNLRKNKGLNQSELAASLGLTRRMISGIESGEHNPTLKQIEVISGYFDVSADYLIFGVDMPTSTDYELLKLIKEDSGLMQSLITALAAKKNVMNRLAA